MKRIADARYDSLDGVGGLYVKGRWHSRGRPIVYLAEHSALALLEIVANMDRPLLALPEYVLLDVEVPEGILIERADWVQADEAICRRFGDDWLSPGRTALCRVRSVIVPDGFNFLLNPDHPDAASIRIVRRGRLPVDPRLAPVSR